MKAREVVASRPLWRLVPHAEGIQGILGDIIRFDTEDLGEILAALGPPTALTEQIAAVCARIVGIQRTEPRPWAYVCSPYAARDGESVAMHVRWAQWLARRAWDDGFWPIVPHLYAPQFLDDTNPAERAIGLQWGLDLLHRAAAVYVLDVPWSGGMQGELAAVSPERQCVVSVALPARMASPVLLCDSSPP